MSFFFSTSPVVELVVTSSDESYVSIIQKELENIIETVLKEANFIYHGVKIVSYGVIQPGLLGFTKCKSTIIIYCLYYPAYKNAK